MKNLKELTREELEEVLLWQNFIGDLEVMNTMKNPKVFYTVMNKIEKANGIKL
jgi:hypothetical protein